MIKQVKKSIETPLIVGGGVNTINKIESAFYAGADMVVIGTAVEKNVNFIEEAVNKRDQLNNAEVKHS